MCAMTFTPKTENQILEAGLWPRGEYDFEVVRAESAKSGPNSKNPGTEFIKLNVQVFDKDGRTRFVNGILHPAMESQVRHFCVVGKMLEKYETGTLCAEDCMGVSGKLKLKIKEAEGQFPAKNEIADYVVPKEKGEAVSAPTPIADDASDDLPF